MLIYFAAEDYTAAEDYIDVFLNGVMCGRPIERGFSAFAENPDSFDELHSTYELLENLA